MYTLDNQIWKTRPSSGIKIYKGCLEIKKLNVLNKNKSKILLVLTNRKGKNIYPFLKKKTRNN